jgi:hypothetical protein
MSPEAIGHSQLLSVHVVGLLSLHAGVHQPVRNSPVPVLERDTLFFPKTYSLLLSSSYKVLIRERLEASIIEKTLI